MRGEEFLFGPKKDLFMLMSVRPQRITEVIWIMYCRLLDLWVLRLWHSVPVCENMCLALNTVLLGMARENTHTRDDRWDGSHETNGWRWVGEEQQQQQQEPLKISLFWRLLFFPDVGLVSNQPEKKVRLVLWDVSFVERLWCIFELAGFLKSHATESSTIETTSSSPNPPVVIRPVLFGPCALAIFGFTCLATWTKPGWDVYLTIEVDDGSLEGKCFRDVMDIFLLEIIKKLHVCKVVFTSILTTVSIVWFGWNANKTDMLLGSFC